MTPLNLPILSVMQLFLYRIFCFYFYFFYKLVDCTDFVENLHSLTKATNFPTCGSQARVLITNTRTEA